MRMVNGCEVLLLSGVERSFVQSRGSSSVGISQRGLYLKTTVDVTATGLLDKIDQAIFMTQFFDGDNKFTVLLPATTFLCIHVN